MSVSLLALPYGYESWTTKKAEHQRTDAFALWCWRRLLRVPWTARSNQSMLKEINPEYSLEELMLKLKLQYSGYLMRRTNSFEKTLMQFGSNAIWERLRARGQGGNRRWTGWMTSSIQWTWVWANSGRQWRTGKTGGLQSMGSQRVGHNWGTEQQQLSTRCSEDQLRWQNGKSGFQTSLGLNPNSPICNLCFVLIVVKWLPP